MNFILVGSLVVSKLFYLSIFAIGDFNFTLSDVCLIAFLARITLRFFTAKDIRDTYDSYIYDYLRRMLIFVSGAFILNVATTVAAGAMPLASILHFFKRWMSMIVIPFYFCSCVKNKEKIVWICMAVMMFYALMNYQSIISANAERYYAEGEFNPNILGALFGLIMVYVINSEYGTSVKIVVSLVSVFMIFACSTRGAVLAVGASIIIYRFLSSKDGDVVAAVRKVLFIGVPLVLGVFLAARFIPTATERIFASFSGGITQTVSFTSRMDSAKKTIAALIYNPRLALFGTGFGTRNQALVLARHGYQITTSDNMYIDMLCWVGAVGIPFVFFYLRDLFMLSRDVDKLGYNSALAITIYMLCLGFTQSAIFEPTIGAIYYILLSFDMVRAMDKEEAERSLSDETEAGDESA